MKKRKQRQKYTQRYPVFDSEFGWRAMGMSKHELHVLGGKHRKLSRKYWQRNPVFAGGRARHFFYNGCISFGRHPRWIPWRKAMRIIERYEIRTGGCKNEET